MSNRQLLLLAGGSLVLLSIGVALIWSITTTLSEMESAPAPMRYTEWTGKAPALSLEDAEQRATESAWAWVGDARLIKVETSWRPAPEDVKLETPPIAWTLYYYSPSKKTVKLAHVHAESFSWGGQHKMRSDAKSLLPFPPPQGLEVAWLSFRAAGGEEFLAEHPDATVQFLLRNKEKLVWTVSAFTKAAKYEVEVDAITGTVLTEDS